MQAEKIKKADPWTVILWVGIGLILVELIVMVDILIAGASRAPSSADAAVTPTKRQIRVPEVPPYPANDLKPEDFTYVDGYLHCLTQDYAMGLDVSVYQGDIDWEQVKQAGFEFVIIRLGGRGYGEEGNLFDDVNAQMYYEGAKSVGMKVGAYFFSQAITEEEALEEAHFTVGLLSSWDLDLPVAYDWEWISEDARTRDIEEDQKIRFTRAYCEYVKSFGYDVMVYAAPWASEAYMQAVWEYTVWVVQYTDQISFPYRFDIWQYSYTGKVPGINVDVDLNIAILRDEE